MILKFAESVEKNISANPAVLSSNIQKFLGPEKETAYLKGSVLFMDSSALDFTIFAKESHHSIVIEKYSFHYRDRQGLMLFRYDNAPHHPELSSFPDHKHIGNNTVSAAPQTIKDILNEITAIILRN